MNKVRPQAGLQQISAENFRSLRSVEVEFQPFTVLAGPNGSGKSSLLSVLHFVRDTAKLGFSEAVARHGGYRSLRCADGGEDPIVLSIKALVTENSSHRAPDEYTVTLSREGNKIQREESFLHKRTPGQGRRIGFSSSGMVANVNRSGRRGGTNFQLTDGDVSTLGMFSTLQIEDLGDGPQEFLDFLSSIRYLDPNVSRARRPSYVELNDDDEDYLGEPVLDDHASNLAAVLLHMSENYRDSFLELQRDISACLPGLKKVDFVQLGGNSRTIVCVIREGDLKQPVQLRDASFGTVRMLALLAALHDPNPPAITIIEEIDHGLHPYALDRLLGRIRAASEKTQIIAATHSPTFVNGLTPSELVLCDRDSETGESIIPIRSTKELEEQLEGTSLGLGELWYSGALEGVPVNG